MYNNTHYHAKENKTRDEAEGSGGGVWDIDYHQPLHFTKQKSEDP